MMRERLKIAGGPAGELVRLTCKEAALSVAALRSGVDDVAYRRLTELGLNENQIKLIERFPESAASFVETALAELQQKGIVDRTGYDAPEYDSYRERVLSSFDHGGKVTYIFDEEARLLYALANILRPRRIVFLGSYYGYWATWALPALAAAGGKATLLDIDADCTALARKNIDRLGFASCAEVLTRDAVAYMRATDETFDWIVLDAEGPKWGVPYDETDKALYHTMAEAAVPRLSSSGLLICHNVLLSHRNDDPYFANMIHNNRRQFYKFTPLVKSAFSRRGELPSTEGVGVYGR